MRPSTHLLSGGAIGALVGSASGFNLLELLVIGAIAGIVPDADRIVGFLRRRSYEPSQSHSLVGATVITVAWLALYLLVRLEPSNPFETVPVLWSAVVVFLASFLHAGLDAMTALGCRLWLPFSDVNVAGTIEADEPYANMAAAVVCICAILFAMLVDIDSLF